MSEDKRLDSGIELEKQQLKESLGDGFSGQLIGQGVMYEVGADFNLIVPHDWLIDRMNDLGLPLWMAPNETAPHYAYDRAINMMQEHWLDEYYIEAPRLDTGVPEDHEVTVDIKEGDGRRIFHVRAEVFFDEEESKEDGGKWVRHSLGRFSYDSDAQMPRATKDDDLGEDDHLMEVWEDVSSAIEALHRKMETHHIAGDIRRMMHKAATDYTKNVIKLRRSVYLFPAGMEDFISKMDTLYRDIDEEWKHTGEPVRIRTFEILDTEEKQEWVQHRVEATLNENVDKILANAFEKFDEGEAASEVIDIIRESLSESEETAEVYNGLLEAEIRIEEALESKKSELADDDKEEIIDEVLSQT